MKKDILRFVFQYCLCFMFLACETSTQNNNKIRVEGKLLNLPDGIITLIDTKRQPIISQKSVKGEFVLEIPRQKYPEPVYVELVHVENKSGFKRLLNFRTSDKFRMTQYFMLENKIFIGDSLEDFVPTNIILPKNIKLVIVSKKIENSRQTQVFNTDSLAMKPKISLNQLKQQIKTHPYSYHYLYELEKRVSTLNNGQFLELMACFDKDVQESKTAQKLRLYILKRNSKKLDFITTMMDREGQKQPVLAKSAKLNMVVLWASWCGPCRDEIPQLKRIFEAFSKNKNFNMVSISVDDNKANWKRALDQEKMPWRQLAITPEAAPYSNELFSFDGSIPTTLFIDNQSKIVKKFVGYDEKSLAEFRGLIEKYTGSNLNPDVFVGKK